MKKVNLIKFSKKNHLDNYILDQIRNYTNVLNKKELNIVLPGGSTPLSFYKKLNDEYKEDFKINIWLSDERLTKNKILKNEFQLNKNIRSNNFNINLFYEKKGIYDIYKIKNSFDFVFLGVGEDGHVASIFPNNMSILNSEEYFCLINDSPKSPKKRITLSKKTLTNTNNLFFIISGKTKLELVNRFFNSRNLVANHFYGIDKTELLYSYEK